MFALEHAGYDVAVAETSSVWVDVVVQATITVETVLVVETEVTVKLLVVAAWGTDVTVDSWPLPWAWVQWW